MANNMAVHLRNVSQHQLDRTPDWLQRRLYMQSVRPMIINILKTQRTV